MNNLFPSSLGADIGSTTTGFVSTPGFYGFVLVIVGVLLGLLVLEILLGVIQNKKEGVE